MTILKVFGVLLIVRLVRVKISLNKSDERRHINSLVGTLTIQETRSTIEHWEICKLLCRAGIVKSIKKGEE